MKFSEFFSSKGDRSSMMRLAIFVVCVISVMLSCSTGVYVVYNTVTKTAIDWSGVSMFIGSLTAFVGTSLGVKVYQKGKE